MRTLILDSLRRRWLASVMQAILIGWVFTFGNESVRGFGLRLAFLLSMVFTAADGAFQSSMAFSQREFASLPLSRRQIWLARWSIGLAPAASALVGKLVAWSALSWGLPHLRISRILLSSVFDFSWTTFCCALLMVAAVQMVRPGFRLRLVFLVVMTAPFWPAVWYRSIPTEWASLTAVHVVTLATSIVCGLSAFLWTPGAVLIPKPVAKATAGRPKTLPRSHSRFRAVASLLSRREIPFWLVVATMIGGVLVAVSAVVGLVGTDEVSLLSGVSIYVLLAFAFASAQSAVPFGAASTLRALRTLPVSSWLITAVLCAPTIILWFGIWALQFSMREWLHLAVPALSLSWLMVLIGIHSTGRAVAFSTPNNRLAATMAIVVFIVGMSLHDKSRIFSMNPPVAVAAAVGAAGVLIGVWLTRHALKSRADVYKRRSFAAPFGMQVPDGLQRQ